MVAIPTARVTAPPERPISVVSPTSFASLLSSPATTLEMWNFAGSALMPK